LEPERGLGPQKRKWSDQPEPEEPTRDPETNHQAEIGPRFDHLTVSRLLKKIIEGIVVQIPL
jgi:hypothetical protein